MIHRVPHRAPAVRRSVSSLLVALAAGLLLDAATLRCGHAFQPATAEQAAEQAGAGPQVPPVPDGTPEQLMKYLEEIRQPKQRPRSRQEMMGYMKEVAGASVQVAEKILAQSKPDDAMQVRASKLKLESLMMLGRLGDEKAAADMAAYAAALVDSPSPELAREAKRMLIVAEAQAMFAKEDLAAAPALIKKTTDLVAADPDDAETAGLAMQLASAFENMPEGEPLAVSMFEALGPIFAKSTNPQIKGMGESFAGTMRRLSLPGKPMEIKGTLLDGTPFDPKSLAGKVVLVDFWATWCGPCVAELPNMLAQYEKYHAKGFEVVGISLDEDQEALKKFVTDKNIPWPVLFEKSEGAGWRHPLATYYGINGIPQLILIGRDGNVITLNARGEKLGERLAELFRDAG